MLSACVQIAPVRITSIIALLSDPVQRQQPPGVQPARVVSVSARHAYGRQLLLLVRSSVALIIGQPALRQPVVSFPDDRPDPIVMLSDA